MNTLIDTLRKRLGALTILFAIPYLIFLGYNIYILFFTYAIRKESCPLGFLTVPLLIWPTLFIFWIKSYVGWKFIKRQFNCRKFYKYSSNLLLIEAGFWLYGYLIKLQITNWIIVFLEVNALFYLYLFFTLFFNKKYLLQDPEPDQFYLGLSVIKVVDMFLASMSALIMITALIGIRHLWIKELPLGANIFNIALVTITLGIIYPYFWCARNIKKFNPISRRNQLIMSSISVLNVFTGMAGLFFSLFPIHLFSIMYLNTQEMRNMYINQPPKSKRKIPQKAVLPLLIVASMLVVAGWLYQYGWMVGCTGFGKYAEVERMIKEAQSKTEHTSIEAIDDFSKANELYDEGKYAQALEVLKKEDARGDISQLQKLMLAQCYGYLGDIEKAKSIGEDIVKLFADNNATDQYNLACYYSVIRDKNKSISHLKRSIDLNKEYIDMAKEDKDFANIKDSPEFKALVESQK